MFRGHYVEGGGWLVSWCVGHLVEPAGPDAYDPQHSKWAYEDLPILPRAWKYQVLPDTKKQFDTLAALMRDGRGDSLVCATDAGREGELIFRLVYEAAGCEKPVQRLWTSSMEEAAIQTGFENLLDSRNYDNLYAAALCRQKADWLVGINATRLFTTIYKGWTLNVGRVMTPTLALLTDREAAIASFQKEKFYTVELDYGTFRAVSERLSSKTDATRLRAACVGKIAVVRAVERKERTERPPKLYDLTTLQREANRLFGYTAQQTLDYAQLLYEKKLATYPRTDSRYLVSGMEAGLPALCGTVSAVLSLPLVESPEAGQVINDSKVSDHHALLPTAELGRADLSAMPTGERNVLTLIAARLLCAVGSPCRYAESAAVLECGGASFTAKGRTMLEAGWKAVERAVLAGIKKGAEAEKQDPPLPELEEGQRLEGVDAALRTGTTTPPPHFTEDTLLSAMEHASAEDFAELEDAERTGLGTPATRASTIEKLVRSGFAERKGRQLLPTEKGTELIRVMPDALKSARLTAEWEAKLGKVERGTLPPGDFLAGIEGMVRQLVQTYAGVTVASSALSGSGRPIVGVCPRCGKSVVEGRKSFFCEGYHDTPPCGFAMWKNDRFFTGKRKELTRKIAAGLLKQGRVHMKDLFSEKKGVLYDATVVLDDTGGKYVRYKLEFDKKGKDAGK
ncbi:MAG TPA: DNA topoisomerase III [Candidatus Fimenecus excrementavium]|nr:DNA topoisomerase III [Candidatus Fimenecus excrementavium]